MLLTYFLAIYEWIVDNGLVALALIYVAIYRKYIYQTFFFSPLAGGNGKIQMDELVKGIVVFMFIWCVRKDALRTHEWAYFSDAFYGVLLAGIFAIAAIKPAVSILNSMKNGKDKGTNDVGVESGSSGGSSDKPVGDH